MGDFASIIGELSRRISALERASANAQMSGTIAKVDEAKGKFRMKLDDGKLGPWIPYSQSMGEMKMHNPPSVGQKMTAFSKGGDWSQGIGIPASESKENPSPSESGSEKKLTFGGVTITLTGDGLIVDTGGATLTMTGDNITLKASEVKTDGKTILDNGARAVVYKGSMDNRGGQNIEGASRVYV